MDEENFADCIECQIANRERLKKRERQAYEEAERKDGKIESRGQGYMG